MLKNVFIFVILFLVISIVPVSAAKIGGVVNNGNNVDETLSTMDCNANEINEYVDKMMNNIANISDSINYIKGNWWKFWKLKELSSHISIINSESKQLKTNAKNIESKAQIIKENSEKLDQQVQYNNSLKDAESIAKQLGDHFKIFFNISKTSPSELESGDIVQLKTEKGYYRYLIFDKIDKENEFALFNGSNGKIDQIPVEQLPSLVTLKITPNYPGFNGSQAVTQIYSIQKENIDQKLDAAKKTANTANRLMIAGESLGGIAALLGIIDIVLWSLVFLTLIYNAVPAVTIVIVVIVLTIAITAILVAYHILNKYAEEMKSSAEADLADLNSFHNSEINHVPVAGNSTVNTESGREVQGVFNATDVDGDNLTSSIVFKPGNGSVNISTNGSFSYTSNKDFFGNDTFSYRVKDSKGNYSNVGWVTVVVKENGTLNITAQNLTVETVKNMPVTVNINCTNVSAGYKVFIVDKPLNGNVTVLNPGNMTFPWVQYVPFKDFVGNNTFSYQLSFNGRTSNIAWINVIVKDNIVNPLSNYNL
ncbi:MULTISPECIES: Ig-like domain-containing protein [Methanobacterium]|uniref:Cadherin domain-containing protein n=1 Tax=Methanobacterium bryantii TaxID=2161 RepID=A0A2A2H615_METBR|nr:MULTISPECIES: Ig-like domain-containing protein [Methanobacterium]OEC88721.1 hypothetical protein A9507_03300 [Methanobacterium sp. A39]PAV04730.1 hypothetical protein ASJ80_10465 [Methanobacterium bryantii]